jgi:hypothetical protein
MWFYEADEFRKNADGSGAGELVHRWSKKGNNSRPP